MQNETQTNVETVIPTVASVDASAQHLQTTDGAIAISAETAAILSTPSDKTPSAIAAKLLAKRAANKAAGKPANAPSSASKPANGKAASKRVASKPASDKPAKPTAEARAAEQAKRDAARADRNDNLSLARAISNGSTAKFYNGGSQPFKAAGDKFKPLNNGSRVCGATGRQAALIVALALYGAKAFKPDGSFVRNAFVVPVHAINPTSTAPRGTTIQAQPESGAISDGRSVRFDYTGTGAFQPDAVIRLRLGACLDCVGANLGEKQRNATRDLLASYGVKQALAMQAAERIGKPAKAPRAA